MILRTEADVETFFTSERSEWQACLGERFETSQAIWSVFPEDIPDELRRDPDGWKNCRRFTDPYRRIRVAYIEAAGKRPAEFRKRPDSFVEKTRQGRLISGYGGVDKYYQ